MRRFLIQYLYMNTYVRLVLAVLLFFGSYTTTLAYNPSINDTVIPYQVYVADSNIEVQAEYLGELTGDPQMYEFTIGADSTLILKVVQLENETAVPFSLIAVKQNNQNAGVVEVGRLKAKDFTWQKQSDRVLGLSFLESPVFEAKIGPGVYRVEVSTPDNFGSYMLLIGAVEAKPGYFKTLGDIHRMQSFFGKTIFHMLLSSYVYYPIGIALLSGLIFYTWRNRKKLQKKYA
jgi:hypothetical protein